MIEVSLVYMRKDKFVDYSNALLVKHNIPQDLVELDCDHCRLLIDAKDKDVAELIKDRLVLMVRDTTQKRRKKIA